MALPPDEQLIAALRAGDESAFAALVDAWSPALLRLAQTMVPSRAVAEEVVQDTWLAVIRGIATFEGRSSLKTWTFRVLANTAMASGRKERRSAPFASLAAADAGDDAGPSVDPDRFLPADHERWPGHWAIAPAEWPEDRLLARETRDVILRAMRELPDAQRAVICLRDVEGWSAEEVCEALDVSAGNQRVLLHRARTAVRNAVEEHLHAFERLV